MPLPIILPLVAALVYAVAAMLVKRSAELGAGVWRTAFVANLISGLAFQSLLGFGGTFHPGLWWQPAIVGLCFVGGQWLMFMSLEKGDVSVATPVLGIKILMVAGLVTWLAGEVLRWQLWVAAILATLGIALLNRVRTPSPHHHVGRTLVTACLSAAAFALFDVLVQQWAPAWGVGRLLPLSLGCSAVYSLGFIARFRAPLRELPPAAWPWLLGGTVAMAVQSIVFVFTLATWRQAAAANVIYSSRGLWTVLLVWLFGHWVRSREQQLGAGVLGWRLAGALLMMAAIALVLG